MQQIYTIWKDDAGTMVLLTADGKPVAAGQTSALTAHLTMAHPPRSAANLVMPAPSAVPVNKQTPVDPVVPRPHAVSGAAG